MIDIILYKRKGQFTGFHSSGHAGFDTYGNDIVCASISVLAINTVNAIESFTEDTIEVDYDDEGLLKLLITDQVSSDSQLLLRAFELGVTAIQEQYGHDYIKIRIEEV